MTTFTLNTKAIKNAISKYVGVNALVRNYKGDLISVWVKTGKEDIEKVEKFFVEFGIKRLLPEGKLVTPFHVNSGEFNGLIGLNEE